MLTSQQEHEVGFWRGLVDQHGHEFYRAFRTAEYEDKTRYFEPLWSEQTGMGIEIGCGCISVLADCGRDFIAIDPLMNEYRKLIDQPLNHVPGDAEHLPEASNKFDWAFCVNMIDHTPYPHRAIEETYRVLKPGGRLFFEVHFDDALSPAHYGLWDEEMVNRIVRPVFTKRLIHKLVRVDQDNQSQYWAVYEK